MSLIDNIRNWSIKMTKSIAAFREQYVQSDWAEPDFYVNYEGRKLRYQILWAWYESTAFRNIHNWAQAYRNSYQLYKYTRNLYNPAFRIVEFWKMMVWGGLLDAEGLEKGAIPIKTVNENIRLPIVKLWKDSNWDINKDITVLYGTAMGDAAIRIVDDPVRGEVRLENIHPASIKSLVIDDRGFVREYEIEETRIKDDGKPATYLEVAKRIPNSDTVKFETYADRKLFAWNGLASSWTKEYGFIPLVAIQHNSVGFDFGWPEIHPLRSKVNDIEDLASKLHDYIRKVIDPVWLFNFAKPKGGKTDTTMNVDTSTSDYKEPGREEVPAMYVSQADAKAQALVTNEISISETSAQIGSMLSELERDLPELQMDIWTVGQDVSGKALGKARQRVERKVIQRRPNYDKALVRAHQMALAIGGEAGYEGYTGFNLESYKAGKLDHTIPSDRIIFMPDPFVEANEKRILWETVARAATSGIPPEVVLKDYGKTDEWIEEFMSKMEAFEAKQMEKAKFTAELAAANKQETDGSTGGKGSSGNEGDSRKGRSTPNNNDKSQKEENVANT